MREVAYPTVGEILEEDFLNPLGITRYKLAKGIGVPQTAVNQIVAGNRRVSAKMGLLLSKYFGVSDSFWTALQMNYDLAVQKVDMADDLKEIEVYQAA